MYSLRGVATRRLDNYLTWFMWIETFKKVNSHDEKLKLLYKQSINGYYETSIRQYRDTPYPFFDYYKNYNNIPKHLINSV